MIWRCNMMRIIATAVGIAILVFSLSIIAHAQGDINFICKNECIEKSGSLGKCNEICSTERKDMKCLDSCMSRNNVTAYSCYSTCRTAGSTSEGGKGIAR